MKISFKYLNKEYEMELDEVNDDDILIKLPTGEILVIHHWLYNNMIPQVCSADNRFTIVEAKEVIKESNVYHFLLTKHNLSDNAKLRKLWNFSFENNLNITNGTKSLKNQIDLFDKLLYLFKTLND